MFNEKLSINKVIFCDLDSVLGSLITSTILKPKYGTIDIIHDIRTSEAQTDVELLRLCTRDVISTCWDEGRTFSALHDAGLKGWRVYKLGSMVEDPSADQIHTTVPPRFRPVPVRKQSVGPKGPHLGIVFDPEIEARLKKRSRGGKKGGMNGDCND